MEAWLVAILWASIAMIIFVTFGYPAILTIAGAVRSRPHHLDDRFEPTVTLIISAHNEERCIRQKVENSLSLDYPRERLEIVVASDGSTDRTGEIVRSFSNKGIIFRGCPRLGKTGIQNLAVKQATGDILVFSDANALYERDAIRKLVRNFVDGSVGCVSGQLTYLSGSGAANSERSYWSYEKYMKRRESGVSSLIGVNGSIYAVRREDYIEIDNDLISDFVEPLAIVRSGKRVIYEPEAISVEEPSISYQGEFRRKVRILTRSITGLLHMRALLNPFRYGVFALQLLVHKLLRYLVPLYLALGFVALTSLAVIGRYRLPFLVSLVAVSAAILVGRWESAVRPNWLTRGCHLLYYYLMVNYALVPAWLNILRGTRLTFWVPERKGA